MRISNITKDFGESFGITKILKDEEFDTLGLAGSDIDLRFCTFIENEKYFNNISKNAVMIITNERLHDSALDKGVCISENPRISYFKIHNFLSKTEEYRIKNSFSTEVGEECKISGLAYISPQNVKIGNNVIIEEFVSIKENVIIGDYSVIRSGTVIGSEGYEFKRINDEVLSVNHIGWVEIGKNVEIQHNTCVDKAIYPWDRTIISDYCKVDNLVHIAHGVKLDKGVFVVAGTLLGGRTQIGKNTWVGVGTTVSNGLSIGKQASINIGAVVTKNVADEASVSGNFAIDHNRFIQFIKSIR